MSRARGKWWIRIRRRRREDKKKLLPADEEIMISKTSFHRKKGGRKTKNLQKSTKRRTCSNATEYGTDIRSKIMDMKG